MNVKQEIFIDLENLVFSARNQVEKLCKLGHMDWQYLASEAMFVEPVIETILCRVKHYSNVQSRVHIILGENKKWLVRQCSRYTFDFAKESRYAGPKNQAADLRIKDALARIRFATGNDVEIVLGSGDGGFLPSLESLYDAGFALQVLGVQWTMHPKYLEVFGTQIVKPLGSQWLNEICTQILRRSKRNQYHCNGSQYSIGR